MIRLKPSKKDNKRNFKWRKLTRHLMRGVLIGYNFSYDLESKTVRTFRFEGEYDWKTKTLYGEYVYEDEKLKPFIPSVYSERLGKNRRRNTNGGWRYGSYNRKDFRAGKRQFVAGKSSREFSRAKQTWWEETV